MNDSGKGRSWGFIDGTLYLVGVAGLAASLTVVWLGMRAVLDVGGYCAENGPYVIAQHCPEGTAVLLPLAVFAGLGSAGLVAWKGAQLGEPWGSLVGLAWPALFISLGWNFLEFALWPPEGIDGIQLGWLIPGILFVIMGAVPLIGFLPGGKSWRSSGADATFAAFTDPDTSSDGLDQQRVRLLTDLVQHAKEQPSATTATAAAAGDSAGQDLVSELERIDALHRSGSLTYDEYRRAKQSLLGGK